MRLETISHAGVAGRCDDGAGAAPVALFIEFGAGNA
jgi:hypothetical protein